MNPPMLSCACFVTTSGNAGTLRTAACHTPLSSKYPFVYRQWGNVSFDYHPPSAIPHTTTTNRHIGARRGNGGGRFYHIPLIHGVSVAQSRFITELAPDDSIRRTTPRCEDPGKPRHYTIQTATGAQEHEADSPKVVAISQV